MITRPAVSEAVLAAIAGPPAEPVPPPRKRRPRRTIEPRSTPSAVRRYGVALLSCAAATLMTLVFGDFMQQNIFLFFPCAVVVGTLYGGLAPGLLTVAINTALIEVLLLAPPGALLAASTVELVRLGFLVLAMVVVALLSDALRTSQRRAVAREDALRESEERFRQLAEYSREVFWLLSADQRQVLYVSPAFEEICGRSPDRLYANPRSWVELLHPDDRERVLAIVAATHREGEVEFRIVRPDGGIRWIRNRAFPVRAADGRIHRIAGVAEDITERRELQEQFRRSQKLEALGRLAGVVAHDFNNTLAVIIGYGQLLRDHLAPDDSRRKYVENTLAAAEQATTLADQLLAFSRKKSVQSELIDLNRIIESMDAILRRLVGEHLDLHLSLGTAIGEVRADPGHIQQVLMNLVVNARDAMPDGGRLHINTHAVTLNERQARRHGVSAGPYVAIAVADTGCGMDSDVLARIFDPFFTTKPPGKGTGLGLSIVYGIVRQVGGGIHVRSSPGTGTTVTLYLPRVDRTTAETEAEPPLQPSHPPEPSRLTRNDPSSSRSAPNP